MFRKSLGLTLLLSALTLQARCQFITTSDATARSIDSLFADIDAQDPGFAVGLCHEGRLIYFKGYGMATLEYPISNTSTTLFNLASLSKQFTAAAVALLIVEGKLSLEDSLGVIFPEYPDFASGIQIKHLIYMTSGLREYYTLPRSGGRSWSPYDYFDIDTAITATLASGTLAFRPGQSWAYSNVNYMILTKIVERRGGVPFSEFCKTRLFEPTGMTSSLIHDELTGPIVGRAQSYLRRSAELTREFKSRGMRVHETGSWAQVPRVSPHYGGSGMFSSVSDLAQWEADLVKHRAFPEPFYKLMTKQMKFEHPKVNDLFGMVLGNYRGMATHWYEGGDLGVSTYVLRFTAQNISIICLSNTGNARAADRAHRIADILARHSILKSK